MTEMHGFIIAFLAQIFVFSILGPLRVTEALRREIGRFVAERTPAVAPGLVAAADRRLRLLRDIGLGTGLVGLLLLAAMIRYMLRPDWTDGPLEAVIPFYFLLQLVPSILAVGVAGRCHGAFKRALPPAIRKALLEPRGLFDFVPRGLVVMAAIVFFLHVGLLVHVARDPFPGFAGLPVNIALAVLQYALFGAGIWVTMRWMGSSPLQGREERLQTVGVAIKILVFSAMFGVASVSLNMLLILVDEQRWEPTFHSLGVIVAGLLARTAMTQQMRIPRDLGFAAGSR